MTMPPEKSIREVLGCSNAEEWQAGDGQSSIWREVRHEGPKVWRQRYAEVNGQVSQAPCSSV